MTSPSTNKRAKNSRVYCDKRERQVAIDGCCDKRGFTIQSRLVHCKALKRARLVYCKTREALSVRLVFRASSGLVIAPATVLNVRQRWGLGECLGLAIEESRALQ